MAETKSKPKSKSRAKSKSSTHSASTGSRVDSAKNILERARTTLKNVQSTARDVRRRNGAKLALSIVQVQRKGFDAYMNGLGRLHDQTSQMLRNVTSNAAWLPDEGRQVIDEWSKATKRGREDFTKTMDTSFDLVTKYFQRLEAGGSGAKKPAAKKKTTAKRSSKKKTAAKSGARKKSPTKTKAKAAATA